MSAYIYCEDEGGRVSCSELPEASKGNTALMVNPAATAEVIIDAALARVRRLDHLTALFDFLTPDALSNVPDDVFGDYLRALNRTSVEAATLLEVALERQPFPAEHSEATE
ncbi:hypothetical protein [Pigmentiphaga daeguensis]|uniref:Uncharacterized protein n=1 Tax=Pigmentiphaga daeguensis TaxID=414049 RepID=A0ABN1B8Q0_9BURK